MANNRFLLSIAIPTYNRSDYLQRLLSVLFEQLRDEKQVELIVSDNASHDKTQSVVVDYQKRGLAIRYVRNETNLGPDRNILQCFNLASGKYAWVFSDDDLIAPETVKRILQTLSNQEYDLVCIRPYFFEGAYVKHKSFVPSADFEFSKAEDFARRVHVLFTFISSIIVNKEKVSSVAHRPFDALFDTNLAQLGPYYTALNYHRRSLLIQDPLIAATGNKNVGYALYRIFGSSLSTITKEWIEEASVQKAIMNGTIGRFFPSWILLTRKTSNRQVQEDPHQVLRACFGRNFRYWAFAYPTYALPLPVAEFWLLGVKVINRLIDIGLRFRARY